MTQTYLFNLAKKMKKANPSFNPIPASKENKRPLGKWGKGCYLFEKDFPTREKWDPECNLGLLVSDDYIVIDVDAKPPAVKGNKKVYSENLGLDDFNALIEQNDPLPKTLSATTPSGGKHYYFKLTGRKDESALKNWTACMSMEDGTLIAVDIRKKGGYVMCDPSMKGTKRYTWDRPEKYAFPMADMPNWILKNILQTMKKHPKHFEAQQYTAEPHLNHDFEDGDLQMFKESEYWQDCFKVDETPNQQNIYRITATAPYQCSLCDREHVKNTNHPFLVRYNNMLRFVCRPGSGFNVVIEPDYAKLWSEIDITFKEFVLKGDMTDAAISQLIYSQLDGTVTATQKKEWWRLFDREIGGWREEERNVIMRPILDAVSEKLLEIKKICAKADGTGDVKLWVYKICNETSDKLKTTLNKRNILSALHELVRDRRMDLLYDSKHQLLNNVNKTVNMETGEVSDPDPKNYCLRSTNLNYLPWEEHPKEKRDLVEKFLNDITLGNKPLLHFLLKVLSSLLTGKIAFQFFFFLSGKGSNGKSLLVSMMKKILGTYCASIPTSLVTQPNMNAESSTPALMTLKGARGVFLTELEQQVLRTEFIKALAGVDDFSGREHYGGQESIQTTARLFIAANELPVVHDRTIGFWRKVVVIPFLANFVENPDPKDPTQRELDITMESRLLECTETFLALLVKYHLEHYVTEGIGRKVQPKIVLDASQSYRYSQNLPLQFYDETCTPHVDCHAETKVVMETFTNFLKSKAVPKTPQLVKQLEALLDEKHPPSNPRRQICNKSTRNKNKRAWMGVICDEAKWQIEDDSEVEEDTANKRQKISN